MRNFMSENGGQDLPPLCLIGKMPVCHNFFLFSPEAKSVLRRVLETTRPATHTACGARVDNPPT